MLATNGHERRVEKGGEGWSRSAGRGIAGSERARGWVERDWNAVTGRLRRSLPRGAPGNETKEEGRKKTIGKNGLTLR